MNDNRRDLDDFAREASNFRSLCRSMGNRAREVSKPIAGLLYVLEETVYRETQEVLIAWGGVVPADAAPPVAAKPAKERARAPKGQGQHRHKFTLAGNTKCLCGAERQRAPKGGAAPAERPIAEARTIPLLGDDRPDRFDGGAFGSSSAADGRR